MLKKLKLDKVRDKHGPESIFLKAIASIKQQTIIVLTSKAYHITTILLLLTKRENPIKETGNFLEET